MDIAKVRLLEDARLKYGEIFPCRLETSLDDCFTIFDKKMTFWFNTSLDTSTRAITIDLQE